MGLDVAVKFRAKLLVVGAVSTAEFEAMLDRGEDYDVGELRRLCEAASSKGVCCRYQPEVGDPVTQIIRAAEDSNADLIVVGAAGFREAEHAMDAEVLKVLRGAHCPVTVINRNQN